MRTKTALTAIAALGLALPVAINANTTAGAATTADTWTAVRLTCRTLTAGKICVALQRYGATNSYRAMYLVDPVAGQWIKPVAAATWTVKEAISGYGRRMWVGNSGYQAVCTGGCASVTASAVIYKMHPGPAVHTLLVDTPQGRFDVHAGITAPTQQTSVNNCLPEMYPSVFARFQLTSTSDNRVWYQRSVGFTGATRPRLLTGTDSGNYRFFTMSLSGTVSSTSTFGSPTYTAPWQRYRSSDGTWSTQRTVASLTYVNDMHQQAVNDSDAFVEFVC